MAPSVVSGGAATSGKVLPDRQGKGFDVAYRALQNISGVDIYVSFGITPADSATNFHKLVPDKSDLNVTSLEAVYVYSASAWKVVVCEQLRTKL